MRNEYFEQPSSTSLSLRACTPAALLVVRLLDGHLKLLPFVLEPVQGTNGIHGLFKVDHVYKPEPLALPGLVPYHFHAGDSTEGRKEFIEGRVLGIFWDVVDEETSGASSQRSQTVRDAGVDGNWVEAHAGEHARSYGPASSSCRGGSSLHQGVDFPSKRSQIVDGIHGGGGGRGSLSGRSIGLRRIGILHQQGLGCSRNHLAINSTDGTLSFTVLVETDKGHTPAHVFAAILHQDLRSDDVPIVPEHLLQLRLRERLGEVSHVQVGVLDGAAGWPGIAHLDGLLLQSKPIHLHDGSLRIHRVAVVDKGVAQTFLVCSVPDDLAALHQAHCAEQVLNILVRHALGKVVHDQVGLGLVLWSLCSCQC